MTEPQAAPPEDAGLLGLIEDVAAARQDLTADDSPFRRRAYVRTVFSAVEGVIHELKGRALKAGVAHPDMFSPAELSLLREETYSLDDRGNARAQPRFIPLAANFLFTFKAYMHSTGCQAALDLSVDGWASFRSAIRVRNRTTHPKTSEDLLVSDEETATVEKGYRWFMSVLARNLLDAIDDLEARNKALRAKLDDA